MKRDEGRVGAVVVFCKSGLSCKVLDGVGGAMLAGVATLMGWWCVWAGHHLMGVAYWRAEMTLIG